MTSWAYDAWPSGEPYDWSPDGEKRRWHDDDKLDFHVDLGCGRIKKARIGVDRNPAPGVNVVCDLDRGATYAGAPHVGEDAALEVFEGVWAGGSQPSDVFLPFANEEIESMVSHHALEHIGEGFFRLMEECWRVLKPGAPFRIIVPLFPGASALGSPDHLRVFQVDTFPLLCQPDFHFAEPFLRGRWDQGALDYTAMPDPADLWDPEKGARELRVTLRKVA